jgi:hypothetical protein
MRTIFDIKIKYKWIKFKDKINSIKDSRLNTSKLKE